MEELANRKSYPQPEAAAIEAMGATAVSIANRWMMGWPVQTAALLKSGKYREHLAIQVEKEQEVLVNEANLRHLAPREILQMYEIKEAPPVLV